MTTKAKAKKKKVKRPLPKRKKKAKALAKKPSPNGASKEQVSSVDQETTSTVGLSDTETGVHAVEEQAGEDANEMGEQEGELSQDDPSGNQGVVN